MPRSGVQFINNEEPSFIKQFKQRIGHTEEAGLDAKRRPLDKVRDEEDGEEKEDEKPVVVVVKEGDLTQDEAVKAQQQVDEGPAHLDQKVTFKKPTKRNKEGQKEEETTEAKSRKTDKGSKPDKVKKSNKSLLSFGDEEEEDE